VTSVVVDTLACLRGGRMLFSGLSLTLAAGGAAMVTGPNGIGKSSLMRVLAGLLPAYAGSVAIDGSIALANEDAALDRGQTLAQALSFWARLDGNNDVSSALVAMGIAHLADVPVRILSTGQRKRAVLARTIASGADVWLLDEPGNGLDTASLDALTQAMARHRNGGGIVIAASHQPLDLPGAVPVAIG
jgi:heme exporter protein A